MITNDNFGAELASLVAAGPVHLPYGVYTVREPLNVRTDQLVAISGEPGTKIIYNGPTNSAFIQINPHQGGEANMWKGRIRLDQLIIETPKTTTNLSIVRSMFSGMQIAWPTFRDLDCYATGYCFDFVNTGYSVKPEFSRVRTRGGGSIRWLANTGGVAGIPSWHASSRMVIGDLHHRPNLGIGPAVDLLGHASAVIRDVVIEGKMHLREDLRGNWQGPIGLRINAPRQGTVIDGLWFELQGTFATHAPGCWVASFRNDSGSGGVKGCKVRVYGGIQNGSAKPNGASFRVFGGRTVAEDALTLQIDDAYQPVATDYETSGKSMIIFDRPTYYQESLANACRDKGFVLLELLRHGTHDMPGIDQLGDRYVGGLDASDTAWRPAQPSYVEQPVLP